jgi:hypothetical protein
MKLVRVVSTAALFLLLGTTAPVYAQDGEQEKGAGGQKAQQAQPAQHQQRPHRTQQAQHTQQQPHRTQQAQRTQQQPQRTQQVQRTQQRGDEQAQVGQHRPQGQLSSGRIPDARFRSSFGREHEFRIYQPVYYGGYSQFQYSGYWFNFNDPWPSDWQHSDDVYVDYYGNVYYLFNPRHPGVRIAISIAL